jgi:uncharacterized membrane protein YsdA (DUF1294 family)
MSTLSGRLKYWDDEQHIGVIAAHDTHEDIIFNIDECVSETRPCIGEKLAFTLKPAPGGKLQAHRVRVSGLRLGNFCFSRLTQEQFLLASLPFIGALLLFSVSAIPLAVYSVLSLLAGLYLYKDQQKQYTFSGNPLLLLLLEALGGWPGSLFTQTALAHHCLNTRYTKISNAIRYTHCALLIAALLWLVTKLLF